MRDKKDLRPMKNGVNWIEIQGENNLKSQTNQFYSAEREGQSNRLES